jgi:CRAL/TRIO domain
MEESNRGSESAPISGAPKASEDTTMHLTQAEVDRARQIKAAVEAREGCRNLSDFEYVQYCLTSPHESIESTCQRVWVMQEFRNEYRIQETPEEGLELFHQFTLQQPGLIMSIDYLESTQNYMTVDDFACYFPSVLKTHEHFRVFFGAFYYLWNAMMPNFTAMRVGISTMTECMGASFDNFDIKVNDKFLHELFKPYPKKHKDGYWLNSPSMATMVVAFFKPYLPKETVEAFHLGHRIDGFEGRLDELYKQPTPEVARQVMIHKFLCLLRMRQARQDSFSLSDVSIME